MRDLKEIRENIRITITNIGVDGGTAFATLPGEKKQMKIIFSIGGGWDHVSVSYANRCPTWEEMCLIKHIFFKDDECVLQYHPAKEDYVNNFPYCLHLWRPQNVEIPKPPKRFV